MGIIKADDTPPKAKPNIRAPIMFGRTKKNSAAAAIEDRKKLNIPIEIPEPIPSASC